jgi:hypothetical protein
LLWASQSQNRPMASLRPSLLGSCGPPEGESTGFLGGPRGCFATRASCVTACLAVSFFPGRVQFEFGGARCFLAMRLSWPGPAFPPVHVPPRVGRAMSSACRLQRRLRTYCGVVANRRFVPIADIVPTPCAFWQEAMRPQAHGRRRAERRVRRSSRLRASERSESIHACS